MAQTIVRTHGEGEAVWFLGSLFDIKATANDTGGEATVVELTVGPKLLAAPPHAHSGAEIAYVIEGTLRYRLGERTVDAGPGTVLYFAKGTWEWFENTSDRQARVLLVYTPGGMDKFFREVGEPAKSRQLPPPPAGPPSQADFERLAAVARRHGLEIKPPPMP